QTTLTLPATLRIHSVREFQTTSLMPPATANGKTNTRTRAVRARATTCQSHDPFRACAMVPMSAKAMLPRSIHKKGRAVRTFNVLVRIVRSRESLGKLGARSDRQLSNLGRQNEVVLVQTIYRVRPDLNRHIAVTDQVQVRVMAFFLGYAPHAVQKV